MKVFLSFSLVKYYVLQLLLGMFEAVSTTIVSYLVAYITTKDMYNIYIFTSVLGIKFVLDVYLRHYAARLFPSIKKKYLLSNKSFFNMPIEDRQGAFTQTDNIMAMLQYDITDIVRMIANIVTYMIMLISISYNSLYAGIAILVMGIIISVAQQNRVSRLAKDSYNFHNESYKVFSTGDKEILSNYLDKSLMLYVARTKVDILGWTILYPIATLLIVSIVIFDDLSVTSIVTVTSVIYGLLSVTDNLSIVQLSLTKAKETLSRLS